VTSTGSTTVPMPITPGAEMDALLRFHPDVTWTGTISENGMGPGSPTMTAVGRGTHRLIQGGRWIVGDCEQDQFGPDGTFVLTWQLHWVAGWDPTNQEYRATLADNYGHAEVMHGHITGDRMVFETVGEAVARLRLVWDASDPSDIIWTNEASINDSPWSLVETYHLSSVST
jgi:hypothetical protein